MKTLLRGLLAAAALSFSANAASTYEFTPPNDPEGSVTAEESNGFFGYGRGVFFEMADDFDLSSIGLFSDFTKVNVLWDIMEVTTFNRALGGTILQSGSGIVSTDGLGWVDFNVAPLTLEAGHAYHVNFKFYTTAHQVFTYYEGNLPSYDDGIFHNINGTMGYMPEVPSMPAIRLTGEGGVMPGIPEPAAWLLFILGFGMAGIVARRRTAMLAI
ncbi:PEP-CTERM sorting domain-containing protein [Gimibacter soli]|uniref:PEP-CTERM sorting domain-containing protein n=1 Tax=Gimibacter soli TaxID=3024400 RepID=A0AAE9XV05_9PROT|nr:PEP-CTERM sorting domain-containing protein [Gimibacter soli]WCL55205.1 PEP-CTERM sorting domain-containing protein [Gimibacter soli]